MKRSLCLALLLPAALLADEGMWLFNAVPKDQLSARFKFTPSQDLLDHLRLSSVRFGGGSGSFVSPQGLIFTNHHVASRCIQNVSSKEHNYMRDGFYAASPDAELKCPGLEVQVLLDISDVTSRINAAVTAKPDSADAAQQRRAAMSATEKECVAAHGGACNVVTLYSGALYHLYQYRKYTDVRLVFAPEEAIAFFGGDPDNFTYPRYDLDITFLRAYENGKPAATPHHLAWSKTGVKDGELALISGHPGSTDRFITLAQFAYMRDVSYPRTLRMLGSIIKSLKQYGAVSPENKRLARDKLFGAENSFKVRDGEFKGLNNPAFFSEKKQLEDKLRAAIAANPQAAQEVGPAFDEIAGAYSAWRSQSSEYLLESGAALCDLFSIARNLVRLSQEKAKPNDQRLREFSDAALPSLQLRLFSSAPITPALEALMLQKYFEMISAELSADHPLVKQILAGRTPAEAAAAYVNSSKLTDVAERQRLASDPAALAASQDGMIQLVRLIDPAARAIRKVYDDRLDAVERAAASRIARARFTLYGASAYPDATGTLRFSFGAVKNYRDAQNEPVPSMVDFAGMYRHATGEEPFKLPQRWLDSKPALKLATPFNFVTTADIIGGNSGSPTVNTRGEVIGIVFDSNYEAMHNRFIYGMANERSVHVASQGIAEALGKVYKANRILSELGL
ncbi:MAG: S46 family peptidase [Acidobacteria bacterium]|nr:S46 family peptidase [Acidobacteriota bacterium]